VGVAAAYGSCYALNIPAMLWGFVSLFFVGASINYVNEYADYETDSLTVKTRYSGGSGVLPKGLVPRKLALQAGWIMLMIGLSFALMGILIGVFNPAAFGVLALGAFGGWMYSLPPLKLAWTGGAEWANALLGGILLPLYGYTLLSASVDLRIIPAFIPYALLIYTTAMATTWPDREADRQVGKRTLATWMSDGQLRRVYVLVSLLCFVVLFILLLGVLPPQVVVTSLVPLPAVIIAAYQYTRVPNPHPTARASMMMAFAQTAAWAWVGWYIRL
jgi:1,4-dihydroxy-2-naphthoate octaprenyltransferase